MARVLIIRLSSFGDVAMLVPAVFSVAQKYPQSRFSVLTRSSFAPLFDNLGFNINVIPINLSGHHSGLIGGFHVVRKMIFSGYSAVADEHDVLRSKILRWSMMLTGRKVRHIRKGRSEKKSMINSKVTEPPLTPTVERYMDVFERLGFPAEMTFDSIMQFMPDNIKDISGIVGKKDGTWIGIAPFAKHQGKIYPLEKIEKVLEQLYQRENTTIFLFGSGKKEKSKLKEWENKYPNTKFISDKLNLQRELVLISYMDVMITMDSANMHLASLVKTPTVSIWGATHPSLGFYGYRQDLNDAVQVDMDCRPCSVYGNKPCDGRGYACLHQITDIMILEKVDQVLSKNRP